MRKTCEYTQQQHKGPAVVFVDMKIYVDNAKVSDG